MCQMIAGIAHQGFSKKEVDSIWNHFQRMSADQTGSHELNQGVLGSFTHRHGWGMSWVDKENADLSTYHSVVPPWLDSIPPEFVKKISATNAFFLHARMASPGLQVGDEYIHPFHGKSASTGPATFCHNGTVFGKDVEIGSDYKMQTESDSERLFYSILSELDRSEQGDNGTLKKTIQKILKYTGANYFILTKNQFIASTNYNRNPKYFTMYFTQTANMVCVSSEPSKDIASVWKPIQNHEILTIPDLTSSNQLVVK